LSLSPVINLVYTLDELAWPHQAVDRGQYPPWHELFARSSVQDMGQSELSQGGGGWVAN